MCACCFTAAANQVVEEEDEEQVLSWLGCFVWLTLVTVLISILSDYIMDAITGTWCGGGWVCVCGGGLGAVLLVATHARVCDVHGLGPTCLGSLPTLFLAPCYLLPLPLVPVYCVLPFLVPLLTASLHTEASKQLRVPMPFLTTIVVPIVGNAAEHASALIFAVKNRMEISLGVAMGEC